ncbi:MAG: hypothetical protein A3I11_08340 [Elusimicrobia bacterium RIFCSPLOWO2_02_FULL_39_32]|nr:MAG: hypothetical protein A3B80_08605 [Elusimicrobia bacterium RIFCSPHIGHO2_02_FULL_39_36]OGR93179.1 MAG: hypothetical protein A3I11_08340 [Elusimicrobia bacterium RIFCSPLOWO2_02_FULL_39_32]OGR99404.1 MAG: hypothetical protein A3G85_06785 [Elusimicrobia bacterium RIFCSPLOWO2_12_FULL_39_28]
MKLPSKKLLLSLSLLFFLGLAFTKVFSLNLSKQTPKALEQELLLTSSNGILPEREANAILGRIENLEVKTHDVKPYEWLEKIAKDVGIPAIAIRSTNNLEDPHLRPHQKIMLQNKKGMVHIAKEGESLESIIKAYERMGGKRETILSLNDLSLITYLEAGQLLLREGTKLWIPTAYRSYPFLARPVNWLRISSRFGVRRHPVTRVRRFHEGTDLVAKYGAPVYAGQNGEITFAGWQGGYGYMIDVRHSKITTRYGHLSQIYVKVGDQVKKKQLIGRVGSTGLSTGPHLHFEVRRNSDGRSVKPSKYLY